MFDLIPEHPVTQSSSEDHHGDPLGWSLHWLEDGKFWIGGHFQPVIEPGNL